MEYRIHPSMTEEAYGEMLRRGWRRHGAHFFRPQCPTCRKCRSLRVDVRQFLPSKSQRRILRRNADVEVVMQSPRVTPEHVRLFNAYHADMSDRRGWPPNITSREDYQTSFLIGSWPFAREMLYRRQGRPIGVGLVDVLPDAISSIYFFHDPAWRPLGPGTFSILTEIDFCRRTGRRFNYLGYCIDECPSMAYKSGYQPHEVLAEYVDEQHEPAWA